MDNEAGILTERMFLSNYQDPAGGIGFFPVNQ